MFYLNHFFRALKSKPFVGLCFGIFSVFLLLLSSNQGLVEKKLLGIKKVSMGGDYFHALVDQKKNTGRITRKLRDLPGVRAVSVVNQKEMKEDVLNVLESLDLGEDVDLGVKGIKVVFESNLPQRSQKLIREYLTRITGKGSITLGHVQKEDQASVDSRNLITKIKSKSGGVALSVTLFFWIVFWALSHRTINEQSYIVEKFQRKAKVAFKSTLFGHFALIALTAPIIWLMKGSWYHFAVYSVAFLLTTLVHYRQPKWRGVA